MKHQASANQSKSSARVINNPADHSLKRSTMMNSRMFYSRLIGALFLAGFAVYGTGFGMMSSVIGTPDFLSTLSAHQGTLIVGVLLMMLNTFVDVGKGVLFFPIVEKYGKRTALTYLSFIVVQVVFLDLGALCLLMLAPLSQYALDATGASVDWATALGALLVQGNTTAYHVGQATLGVGAAFLCLLLYKTRLLPSWLSALGLIGYIVHTVGSVAELFGYPVSNFFLIPGGLFEVVVAFWLIFKGFQPEAYAGRAEDMMPADPSLLPATAAL